MQPVGLDAMTSNEDAMRTIAWESTRPRRRLVAAGGAVVLAAACLPFDLSVARAMQSADWPGFLRDLIELGEYFGHGCGVLLIAVAVAVLVPADRRRVPRLLWASLGAGGAADLLKLCVFRLRPRHGDLTAGTPLGSWVLPPGFDAHSVSTSFPSAHTATAFGLAAILATYYPQGRGLFWCLAALCGFQRVVCLAHYPSDVCVGAAVGLVLAEILLNSPLSRWGFDGFERGERWWFLPAARSAVKTAREDHSIAA